MRRRRPSPLKPDTTILVRLVRRRAWRTAVSRSCTGRSRARPAAEPRASVVVEACWTRPACSSRTGRTARRAHRSGGPAGANSTGHTASRARAIGLDANLDGRVDLAIADRSPCPRRRQRAVARAPRAGGSSTSRLTPSGSPRSRRQCRHATPTNAGAARAARLPSSAPAITVTSSPGSGDAGCPAPEHREIRRASLFLPGRFSQI